MRYQLKAAREAAGKTQREMAEATDISERYYRSIEADTQKPNVETAISIAQVLGCRVEDVFQKELVEV